MNQLANRQKYAKVFPVAGRHDTEDAALQGGCRLAASSPVVGNRTMTETSICSS